MRRWKRIPPQLKNHPMYCQSLSCVAMIVFGGRVREQLIPSDLGSWVRYVVPRFKTRDIMGTTSTAAGIEGTLAICEWGDRAGGREAYAVVHLLGQFAPISQDRESQRR